MTVDPGGGTAAPPGPVSALLVALDAGLNPFAAVGEAIKRSMGVDLGPIPGSSPPVSFGAPPGTGGGTGGFPTPPAPPAPPPAPPPGPSGGPTPPPPTGGGSGGQDIQP